MKDDQDDSTLRALFQELGNQDRAQAPSFGQILGRQVPRQGWGSRLRVAAAVVLFGLGLGFLIKLPDTRPPAAPAERAERAGRQVQSISEWRAPTDVLLKTPGGELLTTVPSLHLTLGAAESGDSTTGRPL